MSQNLEAPQATAIDSSHDAGHLPWDQGMKDGHHQKRADVGTQGAGLQFAKLTSANHFPVDRVPVRKRVATDSGISA